MHKIDRDQGTGDPLGGVGDFRHADSVLGQMRTIPEYDDIAEQMSLALDDRLDAWEQGQFEELLQSDPHLAAEWALWGFLDQEFRAADDVTPAVGFAERLADRLVVAERRRRLRLGLMIALMYVLLWGTIAIGTATLSMLLLWAQPAWVADGIVVGRVWVASATTWLTALGSTGMALVSTPFVRNAGLVYVVVSLSLLFGWMRFLRTSIRIPDSLTRV